MTKSVKWRTLTGTAVKELKLICSYVIHCLASFMHYIIELTIEINICQLSV